MAPHLPTVAVVIPVFNEQEVIPELLRRLTEAFSQMPDINAEVVFVDDGSRDNSATLLAQASAVDPRFTLVRLSRNFGFQAALLAGLHHAATTSDAILTMDADLQDPPDIIPQIIQRWVAGAEVVLALRRTRAETGLRRLGFDLFHRVFTRLVDSPVEPNTGTFGLMDKQAVTALLSLPERNRFFPALRSWVGFRVEHVLYDREERFAGQPGQTFSKLVRYALDGIFSFSYLPLRVLTYSGLLLAGCGFSVALFFTIRRLLGQEIAFTGFTTLVTLTLFIGGVQLIGIGILGEYLGRIYDEVKSRPNFIVRRPPAKLPIALTK